MRFDVCSAVVAACLNLGAWAQPPELIPASQIEAVRAEKKPFFLDVRRPEEIRSQGTLTDYYNIPVEELEKRLDELPKDQMILTA